MKRIALQEDDTPAADDEQDDRRIPSGAELLDCVLGGGYRRGRVVNIVGDRSAGKTLCAIEATANFARISETGLIHYQEVESAFDLAYAQSVGLPVDRVTFGDAAEEPVDTVEGFFAHLEAFAERCKPSRGGGLYVLDSLDALSTKAELGRGIGDATYGTEKARMMSEGFRRMIRKLEQKDVTLIVVSQIREKLGVMFGKKTTRAGGKALDFYASQILYLTNLGKIKRKRGGVERSIGVTVQAYMEKNKAGKPFRLCQFPIIFEYGIDDVRAGLDFLAEAGQLERVGLRTKGDVEAYAKSLEALSPRDYAKQRRKLGVAVRKTWQEIERQFKPKRQKYV